MNSGLLRRLLGIETIPADAADVRLGWEHPLPTWAWFLVVVVAVGLGWWAYRRMRGPTAARAVLGAVRGALLLLLVILLCGPLLVEPREQVERDWVIMLVDRSASLEVADAPSPARRARISRDEQLRAALESARPMLDRLESERVVLWLGFDGSSFDLRREADDASPLLGEASGWRTRIGTALEQALQRGAGRPLAGIVLISDGRTTEPPSRSVVRRLQDLAVPVFGVGLGSAEPVGDLAIRRAAAPLQAFVRDTVPVVVDVERLGVAARELGAEVRLVDLRTGAELDRTRLPGGAAGRDLETVTLIGRSDVAGEASWAVVLDVEGEDLVEENNRRALLVGLVDRPVRVLYVDGYPRWEYRYLKNLLVREPSIESSVLLLSADRDFAQEGNMPLLRLPRTADEFAPYDLVVLGDVPSSFFTAAQLEIIRTAVAERGMGLLFIGGQRSMPSSWGDSPLADLLPMRAPLDLPGAGGPVQMRSTPLAARLGVLRLSDEEAAGWPRELADAAAGWSALQWAQRIEPAQLKPAAEVLAETTESFSGAPLPMVISMRYGAGMSLYVATDEIWRWRFGRGELLPERFWIQMVRLLARERIAGGAETVLLEAEPRRVAPGQPVRVTLRLLDAALAGLELGGVVAVIENAAGDRVGELELRSTGRGGEYTAMWIAAEADASGLGGGSIGTHRVRVSDTTLPEAADAFAEIELLPPDEERRRPETDHPLLRTLAAETGGRFLLPDELDQLDALPRREIRTEDPVTERIWNTPLALALVVLLGVAEWAARRRMGLL
ncbi:MAG TPA: hypothetical protein PKC43_01210 [Phycisphaerales bacterium]|nr:hypothetical protein [Phycisphaerales bacterium]HMP36044.1 hypothetical protein [Phycisphaerales bacterium]